MQKFYTLISLILYLSMGLTACGGNSSSSNPPPSIPSTEESANLLTDPEQATTEAIDSASSTVPPTITPIKIVVTATPTSLPTETPLSTSTSTSTTTPTQAPTVTPLPDPMIKINEDSNTAINIRSGPGTDYPVIDQFQPGQTALITGRNADNTWWQIDLSETESEKILGWIYGDIVTLVGDDGNIEIAEAPPLPPTATPNPVAEAEATNNNQEASDNNDDDETPLTSDQLAEKLDCGKDFCVTYQAMVPIWENGGCMGNHSIYITVLKGLPPGEPMDGVVIGDTFNNVEVGSGSHGPGRTEITLWGNSMTLYAKRHQDGTPYTSEESFNFTAKDELIPPEVLAANGYCDGDVENCRWAHQNNQVCRGHYSWRVTFHKFD